MNDQTTPPITDDGPGRAGGEPGPGKRGNKGGPGPKRQQPQPIVVEVAPVAPPAAMRGRHWGLLASFVLIVLAPLVFLVWYLWWVSVDMYGSTVAFTVRQDEGAAATNLLDGFASQLAGGVQTDTDILYEYIQSAELVERVDAQVDLITHYSAPRAVDPIRAVAPDASIEALTRYWSRVARISYDQATRLIELRVLAFDADTAQRVATIVMTESERLINDLNAQAREDTIRFAQQDLDEAFSRLREARAALTRFRSETQIIDPLTDLQGRLGVVNTLQQQLAAALIDYDLLIERTNADDPRIAQATRRIEVIRERIAEERQTVARGTAEGIGDDYPSLLAEYEGLLVDSEFSAEAYRATLTALDLARANAARQSRYLAAYIRPTLPEVAEFPQRWTILGIGFLFLFLTWSILALIYYSIRDSR